MSEKSNRQPSFGTDIKRLPIKELVKRIGPGLIATGIVIGPGAVTTSAMLGANYGYSLIWLILPIIFMGITFMMTTNRLAIITGLPTIHAIRKYYGPIASAVVSIAVFLSCLFFTMGNMIPCRLVKLRGAALVLPSARMHIVMEGQAVHVTVGDVVRLRQRKTGL